MALVNNTTLKNMTYNGQKVKKWNHNGVRVYSAGSTVTYYVNGTAYTEEVDSGASCLSPATFTPTMSGWTFVGWREDTIASSSVLTSKVMGDSPITLYAVFRYTVTLSYSGNGNTSGSTAAQTGYRYYNNGNVTNPSFTLRANGFARTSCAFYRWASGSTNGTQYAAGASVTLTSSTTFYAKWKYNTVTLSYLGGTACETSFSYTVDGTKYSSLYMNYKVGAWAGEDNEAGLYLKNNSTGAIIWSKVCGAWQETQSTATITLPNAVCTLYNSFDKDGDDSGERAGVVSGTLTGRIV